MTEPVPVAPHVDSVDEQKRWKKWLILLFVLGIIIRLSYVCTTLKKPLGFGDEFSFDILATNLIQHHYFGFDHLKPSVFRPPVYPGIVASIYAVSGLHNFAAVRIIQAIVSAFGAVLLALVGRRISRNNVVGIVAGILFVINPVLIFSTGLLYGETLYLPLLFGIILLWLKMVDEPQKRFQYAAWSGVLFGISHVMRPNLMLFPAALFVWLLLNLPRERRWRDAAIATGIIIVTSTAIVIPWTVRNYAIVHKIVPVSANMGMQVRQGSNDQADGGALDMKYLEPFREMNEAERDNAYMQIGVAWIKSHPSQFVALMPRRLYKFYSPLETSNNGRLSTKLAAIVFVFYAAYYLAAIMGMFTSRQEWRRWLLGYAILAYFSLLAALLYGGTRYSIPAQPFLMLFAAHAVATLGAPFWARFRTKMNQETPQTAG